MGSWKTSYWEEGRGHTTVRQREYTAVLGGLKIMGYVQPEFLDKEEMWGHVLKVKFDRLDVSDSFTEDPEGVYMRDWKYYREHCYEEQEAEDVLERWFNNMREATKRADERWIKWVTKGKNKQVTFDEALSTAKTICALNLGAGI